MKRNSYLRFVALIALFWGINSCSSFAQTQTPTKPLSTAPSSSTKKAKRLSPVAEIHTSLVGSVKLDLQYGSPSVKGRKIWGELVPYGKVWRTGANEATTFEVDKDITVNGQTLTAGRYSLFTIPDKEEWTIIFNSIPDQWGAYNYDETKDVLRITVKPIPHEELTEQLQINVEEQGVVSIMWEYLEIPFKIQKI